MTTETLPETFHAAVDCVADFADRFREGRASTTEVEDADITLIGLRRLLADYKCKCTKEEHANG